ncbi:MAG: hypothetical protein COB02_16325 [Candidatus Cloacimonadota bacterium]|nr:MAG: hypothetical protein COB02_16325 [Candidatus Cloacimonadota bacterium]
MPLSIDNFSQIHLMLEPKNIEFFEKVSKLRKFGYHKKAINNIKLNENLNHFETNILLYRFNLEIKKIQLAKEYLIKAKSLNIFSEYIFLEEAYFYFENRHFEQCIKDYQKVFPNKSQNEVIFVITNELFHRNKSQVALDFIKKFQLNIKKSNHLEQLYFEVSKRSKHDLYYYYYGDLIIFLQLVAPIFLIILSTMALFQTNCFTLFFQAFISFQFNPFQIGPILKQIFIWAFFISAFIPMIYINFKVLLYANSTPKLCSIQINSHYLHIEEFHQVNHYDLNNHPFYITKDDNDFSFSSFIRFLPFVPNLNYIYAYNCFEKSYKVQALWGVVDSFHYQYLNKEKSINMLGIRLAQISHWIHQKKKQNTIIIWLFTLTSPYIISLYFYSKNISNTLLFSHNLFYIFLIYISYNFDKNYLKYLQSSSNKSILKVKVIQFGVLILAFIYFYQIFHYFQVLGLIPTFLCTWMFFHLFIPNKMHGSHKELNAISSRFLIDNKSKVSICEIDYKVFLIPLKEYKKSKFYTLTLYHNTLALSNTLFGFHLYFESLNQELKIINHHDYYTIRFNSKIIQIEKQDFDLLSFFDKNKIAYQVSYTKFKTTYFKGWARPIIISLLFILWEISKFSIFYIGSPNEQNISKNLYAYINKNLTYSGNNYINKSDIINYKIELSKNKKFLIISQVSLPSFEQYEIFLKNKLLKNPSYPISFPPEIKPYQARFEVFSFIKWHTYTKHKKFSSNQYSSIYKNYCKMTNNYFIKVNDLKICGRKYNLKFELQNYPEFYYVLPKGIQDKINPQ